MGFWDMAIIRLKNHLRWFKDCKAFSMLKLEATIMVQSIHKVKFIPGEEGMLDSLLFRLTKMG